MNINKNTKYKIHKLQKTIIQRYKNKQNTKNKIINTKHKIHKRQYIILKM